MKKILTAIAMLLFAGMAAMAQETTYAKSDFVPGDEIMICWMDMRKRHSSRDAT